MNCLGYNVPWISQQALKAIDIKKTLTSRIKSIS